MNILIAIEALLDHLLVYLGVMFLLLQLYFAGGYGQGGNYGGGGGGGGAGYRR